MRRANGSKSKKQVRLSESSEMYLQIIWKLTENGGEVSITDIARALGHSLSTVSERVVRLTKAGFLRHRWREQVTMTHKGRKIACSIIRKRRLLKTFLFQMAGYGIQELHQEACRLEHVISERLADALETMLANPPYDPHGHPIPSRDGTVMKEFFKPLSSVDEGKTVRITQLKSVEPAVLEYVACLGLLPGRICTVVQKAPFQGPLTITDGSERISISYEVASIIGTYGETVSCIDAIERGRVSYMPTGRLVAGP